MLTHSFPRISHIVHSLVELPSPPRPPSILRYNSTHVPSHPGYTQHPMRPIKLIAMHSKDLSALPFEIQLEILSLVPARYIFSLRRVSRAWNIMLSNPELERILMAQRQFLTSATSLAAMTKRHLRMLRNEPVSVTYQLYGSCNLDLIPSIITERTRTNRYLTRHHLGYDILIESSERNYETGRFYARKPRLVLEITNRRTRKEVSVDLLQLMQSLLPEVYEEFGGDWRVPQTVRGLEPCHLHVQEQKILVGLQLARLKPSQIDDEPLHFEVSYTGRYGNRIFASSIRIMLINSFNHAAGISSFLSFQPAVLSNIGTFQLSFAN